MLLILGAWLSSAVVWGTFLWFGLSIDLSKYSPLALIALHTAPPLGMTCLAWLWRRAHNRRSAAEEAVKVTMENEKREAARTAAQTEHDRHMQRRRQACDCRAIAVTGLIAQNEQVIETLPTLEGIHWGVIDAESLTESANPLSGMMPYLEEALSMLYQHSPAAIWLPHFISPPNDVTGEELILTVREAAHAAAEHIVHGEIPSVLVRFLPESDHTTERYLDIFESDPALPGAVILGFDSPYLRQGPIEDDAFLIENPTAKEARHWQGQPSQAIAALLLTAPWLENHSADLQADTSMPEDGNAYTPYWERNHARDNEAWLARIPAFCRASLLEPIVLAHLHRGGYRQAKPGAVRPLALAEFCRAALDRALVNSGLRDLPFDTDCPLEPQAPLSNICRWLVHHAGSVERSGVRLAALGNALTYFDIDLHPIDEANNCVTQFGHVGRALPVLLSALTVAHAARNGGAICAEFPSDSEFASWLALAPVHA